MPLPPDFALVLDQDVQFLAGRDHATVLLGGSPLRLLRLEPRTKAVFDQLAARTPLSAVVGAGTAAVAQLARRLLDGGFAHPVWPADGGPTTASVTIVIPVRDRAAELRRLLASLDIAPSQVLVVDDASLDDSAAVAREFGARVIRNKTPGGPGAARNAGLAEVTTPFVVFVDWIVAFFF